MYINNIAICTVLRASEDVLGPGEGSYYENDRNRELSNLKYQKDLSYSNPLDLAHCSAHTILARFGHLTYDEQMALTVVKIAMVKQSCVRSKWQGSCSTQIYSIIWVVFTIVVRAEPRNLICHLDQNISRLIPQTFY
jgi:hypothetical protein